MPPAGPHPSVWDLKQFLEINEPVDHPPVPSVNVDYGFINCHTFEETCTLMEIYREVLKTADPLELHQACLVGDLFQFASGYVPMEEQWRFLMTNFYPLTEVGESEMEPELRSEVEVELEADEDSAGLPSLFSSLWRFIGGFVS